MNGQNSNVMLITDWPQCFLLNIDFYSTPSICNLLQFTPFKMNPFCYLSNCISSTAWTSHGQPSSYSFRTLPGSDKSPVPRLLLTVAFMRDISAPCPCDPLSESWGEECTVLLSGELVHSCSSHHLTHDLRARGSSSYLRLSRQCSDFPSWNPRNNQLYIL